MLHHFYIQLFGREFYIHTNTWMMAIFAATSVLAFVLMFRSEKLMWRAFIVAVGTTVCAFFGARLFHLLFERGDAPVTFADFTHFDGMTYYGSLVGGLAFALTATVLIFPRFSWPKVSDLAALIAAFGYGFLRIGCFANGCCWGRLTSVPWSVVYGPGSEMPYIGLPVHPVQLYDSFCGFFVFSILIVLYRRRYVAGHFGKYVGLGMPVFLVLSSVGRFITEFFRGDAYRGTNVIGHLSTSQSVAVLLFFVGSLWIVRMRFELWTLVLSCLFLSGCFLPEAPVRGSFVNVEKTPLFTVYSMNPTPETTPSIVTGGVPKRMLPTSKNLIFITADNVTGRQFEPQLRDAYHEENPPSLNEVSWWQLVPVLRDEYKKVIYLPVDDAKYANIEASIQYMESEAETYDLIILSHGIPNHLTNGDPGYFLSFKEIDELKGHLTKLNLVFMQACFGQSLANDWLKAGAKKVMAFDGFNRNFFFISVFLDHHRWYSDEDAFATANRDMRNELKQGWLYRQLISRGLGLTVDEYLQQVEEPRLSIVSP